MKNKSVRLWHTSFSDLHIVDVDIQMAFQNSFQQQLISDAKHFNICLFAVVSSRFVSSEYFDSERQVEILKMSIVESIFIVGLSFILIFPSISRRGVGDSYRIYELKKY